MAKIRVHINFGSTTKTLMNKVHAKLKMELCSFVYANVHRTSGSSKRQEEPDFI